MVLFWFVFYSIYMEIRYTTACDKHFLSFSMCFKVITLFV